jgi:broad specificity phosphatase PhoE
MTTKIYLIRHGESHQNIDDVLSGVTDVSLSELGKEQCAKLSRYFENVPIAKVYATPLQRAIESAEIIFPKHKSFIEISEALIEFNYGDYEGYERTEYGDSNDNIIQKWVTAPADLTFPGGDNVQEHARKAFTGITELATKNKNSIIACISHRTTIRLIIAQIVGLPLDNFRTLPCSNCGIFEIEYDSKWQLHSLNVTLKYLYNEGDNYGYF